MQQSSHSVLTSNDLRRGPQGTPNVPGAPVQDGGGVIRRVINRLSIVACLGAAMACSGPTPEADTGLADVEPEDTDEQDTEVDTTDSDTNDADTSDADTNDTAETCLPGLTRCVQVDAPVYEICGDAGTWELEQCDEGDVCIDGICGREGACEARAVTSCAGFDRYIGCNNRGTAEGEWDVPGDLTCIEEDGVAALASRDCFQGQTRCADEQTLERCAPSGLDWEFSTNCQSDDNTTLCDINQCVPLCEYIAKRDTYVGCEYWALDLDNAFVRAGGSVPYYDAQGAQFSVVVTNVTESVDAEVTVNTVDGEIASVTLAPGELRVINLPESGINGTMLGFEAYQVVSSVPIIAYQFNPLENELVFSNDASLLFPSTSLGTEYYVMTRRQTFDLLKGYVTVAAVLPGETEVTVELPPYTDLNPVITLGGDGIPALRGGDVYTVTMQQFEVLNIETNRAGADLTGTHVTSNRPVAVFGGSEAANAPNDDSCIYRERQDDWVCEADRETPCINASGEPDIQLCSDFITCCADHLEHQMLPLFAYGSNFNATRSYPRADEADVWRIMAGADNVTVQLTGLPDSWELPFMIPNRRTWVIDEGEWFEVQSPIDFQITADGPLMLGQFLAAEQAPYPSSIGSQRPPHEDAGTGDPAFIIVPPIEQYRTDYTFLAPNAYAFDYVVITAPTDAEVQLDGELIAEEEWILFGDGNYHVARLAIEDGVHDVVADLPVGVTVMGYDQYVSYGYAGGLDIREIFSR